MIRDIKKVCVSQEELADMTARIGKQISIDYEGKNPLIIGLLKGCVPFMSDMLKNITIYCNEEFIKVSSYVGTKSSGSITVKGNIPNVKDRDVIIVDDILDTGRTLNAVKELLYQEGAKSVEVCVMLDKPEGRIVDVQAKYIGGIVPNEFVVGYGLDYNEQYRNLPFIGVLKEEVYKK